MLDLASAAGMRFLDTARSYGESEAVLGALDVTPRFSIVTKIAALNGAGPDALVRSLEASLAALRIRHVAALMMHAAGDLLGPQGDANWHALEVLRGNGSCARIGVSVYRPEEARTILDRYPLSVLQLPANIFDQRFARAGILDMCHERGIEVHVRSAFLQGFLLADPKVLPHSLRAYQPLLERVIACARDRGVSRAALALAPLLADERLSAVVIGVDSVSQLEQLLEAARLQIGALNTLEHLATNDEKLLDPRNWK
jgi:aryl-alcohol dehydrogenase-like predicted oxidoreductase